MGSLEQQQRTICRDRSTDFVPPLPGTKVGIALQTLGRLPIHGARVLPTESTCGWFIFSGDEASEAVDFYQPLCVEHLGKYCPAVLPFLGLPPGWRFMIDGLGFMDVWQDDELLSDTPDGEDDDNPDRRT
jgi:hypothetical protein